MPETLMQYWERLWDEEEAAAEKADKLLDELFGEVPFGMEEFSDDEMLARLQELMESDQDVMTLAGMFSSDDLFAMSKRRRELEAGNGRTS